MKNKQLSRLLTPISDQGLIAALRSNSDLPVEVIDETVDLTIFDKCISNLLANNKTQSSIDTELVEPLHRALRDLPLETLVDMRLWHWLAVVRHPDLVWLRWRGVVPVDPEDGFKSGKGMRQVPPVRFLGSASINGHARNTFARLFFAAQRLIGSKGEDYDLVRRLFTSQELHLGISDREFGLLPSVNRVLVKELADLPDSKLRSSVRKLNSLGGSFCLDFLDDDEISELLGVEVH